LAGDFNNWDVNNLPMKKDNKGTWEASFALTPGRYEYRLWVDEVWLDDPNAQERVENPFGSQNCACEKIISPRVIKNAPASAEALRAGRQMQVELCEIPLAGAPDILRPQNIIKKHTWRVRRNNLPC
jgi:hypothetical protein